MLHGSVRFQVLETEGLAGRSRSASAMAELFAPLDWLLAAGGDSRLAINPASGLNEYGCQPTPCPETLSFSSSTATSISERAYHRAQAAREGLMRSAIEVGIEAAFDDRVEEMRDELRAHLGLAPDWPTSCFRRPVRIRNFRRCFSRARCSAPNSSRSSSRPTRPAAEPSIRRAVATSARRRRMAAGFKRASRLRASLGAVTSVALPLFDEAGQARSPCRQRFDGVRRRRARCCGRRQGAASGDGFLEVRLARAER